MAVAGPLGVGIERFAYRPLRNAPRLAPLITAIGVSFILQNVIQVLSAARRRPTPADLPRRAAFRPAGRSIGWLDVFISSIAIVLMVGLQLFVGAHEAGPRDALHGAGPRGGAADGRRHQPDDRR